MSKNLLLFLLLKVSELAGFLWYTCKMNIFRLLINQIFAAIKNCCRWVNYRLSFVLTSQITEGKAFQLDFYVCTDLGRVCLRSSEDGHRVSTPCLLLGFLVIKTVARQWLTGWWCLLCAVFFFFLSSTHGQLVSVPEHLLKLADMFCFEMIRDFSY